MTTQTKIEQPAVDEYFLSDVLSGLSDSEQKNIPSKYFYDKTGSKLYDQICCLDEYYPTRTEVSIMERSVREISSLLGDDPYLVEYGSGSSTKTKILLDNIRNLAGYSPIDISEQHLLDTTDRLNSQYADLEINPVAADYTAPFILPDEVRQTENRVIYYPGSSIGNFDPDDAIDIMRNIRQLAGDKGKLLIGIDLIKPIPILEAAYNDLKGVTAAFNKNLLSRINHELDGSFDLATFQHRALFNQAAHRIEMHLVSLTNQTVYVDNRPFTFTKGESIHTENSYKYSLSRFDSFAKAAGWTLKSRWTDNQSWFGVLLFE